MPIVSSLSMGTSMFNCTTPGKRPISTPPVMVQRLRTSASVMCNTPAARLQRHAIRVTPPDQEVAEVSSVARVGHISTWCCTDSPNRRAQAGQCTRKGVWLKEKNGVLARVRGEGRHSTGALRKIMCVGVVYSQADLAIVIEDDSIALFKTERIDDRAALDAANAALSGPLDTAGRPWHAAARALLINERIVAKGCVVRHHRTRGGGQR